MNTNSCDTDPPARARISKVARPDESRIGRVAVPCREVFANQAGKAPLRAIASGSSPWTRMRPLSAPVQLIAANRPISKASRGSQKWATNRAKGASEWVSSAAGRNIAIGVDDRM